MNGQTETRAIWGKISLMSGLSAAILSGGGFFVAYLVKEEMVFFVPALLAVFLVVVGILSGIAGLFLKRAFGGLMINLLLVVAGYAFFVYMFTTCCAPPLPLVN